MRPRWLKVKAAISAGCPLKCREPFLSGFPTMSENRWSRTFAVGSRARSPSPFEVCAEREAGLGNLRTFSKSAPLTTVAIPSPMASVHAINVMLHFRFMAVNAVFPRIEVDAHGRAVRVNRRIRRHRLCRPSFLQSLSSKTNSSTFNGVNDNIISSPPASRKW